MERVVTVEAGILFPTPEIGRAKFDRPEAPKEGEPFCKGKGKEEGCPAHGGDCAYPVCYP